MCSGSPDIVALSDLLQDSWVTEWAFLPDPSSLGLLRAITVTGLRWQTDSSSDGLLQATLGLPPRAACHSLGLKLSRSISSLSPSPHPVRAPHLSSLLAHPQARIALGVVPLCNMNPWPLLSLSTGTVWQVSTHKLKNCLN